MTEATPQLPGLEQLVAYQHAITDLRSALERLETARDRSMRDLDRRGTLNRSQVARELGMTRGRVWQILNPEVDEIQMEDGSVEHEPNELNGRYFEQLMEEAWEQWQADGSQGDVYDYFDVEAGLRDR